VTSDGRSTVYRHPDPAAPARYDQRDHTARSSPEWNQQPQARTLNPGSGTRQLAASPRGQHRQTPVGLRCGWRTRATKRTRVEGEPRKVTRGAEGRG